MSIDNKQNNYPSKSKIGQYQKVGNPIRVGKHNYQYFKDSKGNLICATRPLFQKIGPQV